MPKAFTDGNEENKEGGRDPIRGFGQSLSGVRGRGPVSDKVCGSGGRAFGSGKPLQRNNLGFTEVKLGSKPLQSPLQAGTKAVTRDVMRETGCVKHGRLGESVRKC